MKELPVIQTFKDAVSYTFNNMTMLIKAAMVWLLLYTVVVGLFSFSGGDALVKAFATWANNSQTSNIDDPFFAFRILGETWDGVGSLVQILYISLMAIGFIAYYSIAISWHRACLLDEVPPMFRFGALELKYFFVSLLLVIILFTLYFIATFVIGSVVGIVSSMTGGSTVATGVIIPIIVLTIVLFLAFGRFSLAFPGIAVGDRRMGLKTSFNATKGNSWRILGGSLLCFIPALVISMIVGLLSSIGLPLVISMPIALIANLIGGAFILSFMSICYQILVPPPEEGDLA